MVLGVSILKHFRVYVELTKIIPNYHQVLPRITRALPQVCKSGPGCSKHR